MYRAAFYNPILNSVTEVFINYEQEVEYISVLLNCTDIDLISFNNKFLIAYDIDGWQKIDNILSKINGIDNPLPGSFIITGNLDANGLMTSLPDSITSEWLDEIIKPFAKIIEI